MQIIRPSRIYPVIVIGSGAAGGMAAWNLTRQGIEVCLLDAGTKFDRGKYWTHVTPYEARARRARGQSPLGVPGNGRRDQKVRRWIRG
jgi:choline dehydrogenase-like flavoprotein